MRCPGLSTENWHAEAARSPVPLRSAPPPVPGSRPRLTAAGLEAGPARRRKRRPKTRDERVPALRATAGAHMAEGEREIFMAVHRIQGAVGGREIFLETGKLARQAGGAVVVGIAETQVLVTATAGRTPKEQLDFFPLTVDVEARMYAAGKIPGGFFRREGRPSETAILTARLIDRPLRPTFRAGYNDEVQVVVTVLSADLANPYDVPGINGASLSTMIAGLPFDGPVGAVRLGLIGGEWSINPTYQDLDMATFDVVVAGRRNESGSIDLLMIEGEAPDNTWSLLAGGGAAVAPTEESVAEGLEVAKRAIGEMIDFQLQFLSEVEATPKPFEPKVLFSEQTYQTVAD